MGRNALHHAALGSSTPDAPAVISALLAAIRPIPPPTHFAPSRRLPPPLPWDATDYSGQSPLDICRDARVIALLRRHREDHARKIRSDTPSPAHLSSALPAEWARRLRQLVQGSDAWPAASAAGARELMLEVLTAVEATGGAPPSPTHGGTQGGTHGGARGSTRGGTQGGTHGGTRADMLRVNSRQQTAEEACLSRMERAMPRGLHRRTVEVMERLEAKGAGGSHWTAAAMSAPHSQSVAAKGASANQIRAGVRLDDRRLVEMAVRVCGELIEWCS